MLTLVSVMFYNIICFYTNLGNRDNFGIVVVAYETRMVAVYFILFYLIKYEFENYDCC